jgi:hypothetical protein
MNTNHNENKPNDQITDSNLTNEPGVYKYEVGNNVHLMDNKFPHDFSKKIDVEKQNAIDLGQTEKRDSKGIYNKL